MILEFLTVGVIIHIDNYEIEQLLKEIHQYQYIEKFHKFDLDELYLHELEQPEQIFDLLVLLIILKIYIVYEITHIDNYEIEQQIIQVFL